MTLPLRLLLPALLAFLPTFVQAQVDTTSYASAEQARYRTIFDGTNTTFLALVGPIGELPNSLLVWSDSFRGDGFLNYFSSASPAWGDPSLFFEPSLFQEGFPSDDGRFDSAIYFESARTTSGIYGCDVPDEAYVAPENADVYGWGFYQICPDTGPNSWISIELVSRGRWTLNDYVTEGFPPAWGPVTLATPEPMTLALLATGLVGLGAVGWRRRRQGVA